MWPALTLGSIAVVAGIAWFLAIVHSIRDGSSVAASIVAVPLAYCVVIGVATAVDFALAWLYRAPRPPVVRIGPGATLRLVWNELRALAGAAPRMMFYRRLVPDRPGPETGVPVILVHGVLCNAGVFARLARFLATCGVDGVYALSYGPPLASIEIFAGQLARKIDTVLAATGASRVVVISHSMGGLVVRAYLRKHGAARLARVLTIAAPHHGSVHAWLFPGMALAQLRPGNPWLTELANEPIDPALRVVSLWSWHDSMVAPQTSSRLAGTIDLPIVGVGHNALLGDSRVFAQVLTEIEAARSAPAASECLG